MFSRDPLRSGPVHGLRTARFWAVFAGPGLCLYVLFVGVPIVMNAMQSLTNKNTFNPSTKNVGLRNYRELFSDPAFHAALHNSLVLALLIVIVPNVIGLAIAVMLDRPGRLSTLLRSLFFVPVILSPVVVAVIWQLILSDGGVLDSSLAHLGIHHPPGWLSNPHLALYTLGAVMAWQVTGFCVVVYLAGLQTVPHELYEAASLDGAGAWSRFRTITWPMLAPATSVNTVMLLIGAFKAYDQVKVMTGGGPGTGSTSTLAFNTVTMAFDASRIGYSAAYSMVTLVLVASLSVLCLWYLQRRERKIA